MASRAAVSCSSPRSAPTGTSPALASWALTSPHTPSVTMASGSDFDIEVLDPLWGLQRIVTRTEFDGTPPGGWLPGQRLDLSSALHLITTADAFGSFEEHDRGSVEVGKYADLVVIRENLF